MRILVLSDSHKHCGYMAVVIDRLKNDIKHVVHLGDCREDAEKMSLRFPGLSFEWVEGNCDFSTSLPYKIIHIGGKRIFITHGHNYGVKRDYQRIIYAALEKEADACFFGHTHKPVLFYESGVLFLNPGSISLPRGYPLPSYGIVDISEKGIEAGINEYRP